MMDSFVIRMSKTNTTLLSSSLIHTLSFGGDKDKQTDR